MAISCGRRFLTTVSDCRAKSELFFVSVRVGAPRTRQASEVDNGRRRQGDSPTALPTMEGVNFCLNGEVDGLPQDAGNGLP